MAVNPALIDLTPQEPEFIDFQALEKGIELFDQQQLKRWLIRNFDLVRGTLGEHKTAIDDVLTPGLARFEEAYVFPEQFAAVGDGTTDDTTAIENALNTKKKVLIRQGKSYAITGITISEDECIQGLGGKIVTHSSILSTANLFTLDGSRATLRDCVIEINHALEDAIRIEPAGSGSDIYDVLIKNNIFTCAAVDAQIITAEDNGARHIFRLKFEGNKLDFTASTHASNLSFMRGLIDSLWNENIFLQGTAPTDLIRFFDSQNVIFTNNKMVIDTATLNNGRCLRWEPNAASDYCIVDSNYFESPRGMTLINLDNAVVSNNIFNGQTGYAVDGFGYDNCNVCNNIMRTTGTYLVGYTTSATKLDTNNIKN